MRLPSELTVATATDVAKAMSIGWWHRFSEVPLKGSIALLTAQSALETGMWKRMICWSLGGVKSRAVDDRDYTYFSTTECVSVRTAEAMIRGGQPRTDGAGMDSEIVGTCANGTTKVRLHPDNPGCRFRAYRTLNEAAADHISLLYTHKTFSKAWPAIEAGNPELFATRLKEAGYYTAPVEEYLAGVKSYFLKFCKLAFEPSDAVTGFFIETDKTERDRIQASVAMSMTSLVDELAEDGWRGDDE